MPRNGKVRARRGRFVMRAVVEAMEVRCLLSVEVASFADAFVDSIGINTHFSWSSSRYAVPATLTSLGQSGIRHVRDNLKSTGLSRVQSAYDSYGIRTDIVVDDFGVPISQQVDALANAWASSIEGANEPDLNSRTYAGLTDDTAAGGTNTYAATRRFQSDLFAAVNADARTSAKPVRSPAVGYTVRTGMLAGTDFDEAAVHIYPPATNPDYWRTDAAYLPAAAVMNDAGKPLVITETGYNTSTADFEVDDATQGKYIPRLLAESFNRGIDRTYLYEFSDGGTDPANKEHNFGIINYDGTPKPAYTNLKNLISLLGESTWNTTTKQWTTPSFTAGSLDYTLTGDTTGVHKLLLQKSNGEFYLMLWNETSSYDGTAPIAVPNKAVSVTINTPLASASRYTLASTTSAGTYIDPQSINLGVSDSIVVLRLTPRAAQTPTPVGVSDNFEGATLNALPAGWTQNAGDDWQVKNTTSPANKWLENRNVSGGRSIARNLGTTVTGSWTVDFDHTWRWGGWAAAPSNGFHNLSIALDMLDAAGNGYRVKIFQGNGNNASYDNDLTEIYKVTAGVQGASPLTTGGGYNHAGWQSVGASTPDWRHVRVSFDAASHTLFVYEDPDANGVYDVVARTTDSSYSSFSKMALSAPDLSATCAPVFDNITMAVPTVTIDATDDTAAENPANAGVFTVSRTGSTAAAMTVAYAVGGTAAVGTDYNTLTGTVTIPAGSASTTITINPTADSTAVAEGDEAVILSLREGLGYHVGDRRSDQVTITDYAADLIVTDIAWDAAPPTVGQPVKFRATVKNVGNAPSPAGTVGVHFYTDVNSVAFGGVVFSNTSIVAGASLVFQNAVGSTASEWIPSTAGNQVITAWVDRNPNFWPNPTGVIAEKSDLNNQTFEVIAVASASVGDSFNSATVGQPPANWTTSGDGWMVKNEAGQTFLENTTTGTGTRSITKALPGAHSGSWSLDFKHTWRWGGHSNGLGFRSLSVSSDIVDANGNGVRVRFYQGSSGNAAYNNSLVEIYQMTNGVQAASPLATGGGFDRSGWKSVAAAAPDWRAVRVSFDRGTRKVTVSADLAGNGVYQRLAVGVLDNAPANVTKFTLNAEGLVNTVGPEFDDVRMDLFP